MKNMKTAILYHQVKPGVDCTDGITAAWVAKRRYPDAKLIGVSHGQAIPDLILDQNQNFQQVIVVDFYFPLKAIELLESSGIKVQIIDHHISAQQELFSFKNAVFDMNESGATLAWKVLFPDQKMPIFLEYIRDRDLWINELPFSEEFHETINFLGKQLYQFDFLAGLEQSDLNAIIIPIGTKLIESKKVIVNYIASTYSAKKCSINGRQVLFALVEVPAEYDSFKSDICAKIRELDSSIDFQVAYIWNPDLNYYNLTFRSNRDNLEAIDVSKVAGLFEGGGHKNAAGATILNLSYLEKINQPRCKQRGISSDPISWF